MSGNLEKCEKFQKYDPLIISEIHFYEEVCSSYRINTLYEHFIRQMFVCCTPLMVDSLIFGGIVCSFCYILRFLSCDAPIPNILNVIFLRSYDPAS